VRESRPRAHAPLHEENKSARLLGLALGNLSSREAFTSPSSSSDVPEKTKQFHVPKLLNGKPTCKDERNL